MAGGEIRVKGCEASQAKLEQLQAKLSQSEIGEGIRWHREALSDVGRQRSVSGFRQC
jgi:hypothetical protein